MRKRTRRTLDLVALAGLALGLLVCLAVLSYDPADPPSTAVFPANGKPANLLQHIGALVAYELMEFFGWSIFPLLAAWLVVVLTLLLSGRRGVWCWRLLGWFALVPGVSLLADLLGPRLLGGPALGPGGRLGASLHALLLTHLMPLGVRIVALAAVLGGLGLAGDFVWPKLFGWLSARLRAHRQHRILRELQAAEGRLLDAERPGKPAERLPPANDSRPQPEEPLPLEPPLPPTTPVSMIPVPPTPDSIPLTRYQELPPSQQVAEEASIADSPRPALQEPVAPESPPVPLTIESAAATDRLEPLIPLAPVETPVVSAPSAEPANAALECVALSPVEPTSALTLVGSTGGESATTPPPQTAPEPPAVSHAAPLPPATPSNAYRLPPFELLADPEPFPYELHDQQLRDRAVKLEKTFTDFDLHVRVVGINTGPVITQYEVALETGLRVNKVTRLADDLALNLKVPSVRMVAPIPGKDTVGIEIPNDYRAVVRLKEVILNAPPNVAKYKIPLYLGRDVEGRPLVYDLAEMPHLLIAGRTGTGKSVCMNAIILSMLMTRRPDEVRMIMIDPKMLELSEYGKIPHLMHPVVKDMKKAEAILAWAVDKMEERYDILSRARVRSIAGYNELSPDEIYRRVRPVDDDERARIPERMPYIVIFVDEMNDLMMTMKKEVEGHIIRLAQKSRAAGIHLVVATQKPTVDVITGLIKSNLPARICFQVSSRSDSRVVLDEMGAEKLLGKGDMLFLQPGTSTIIRAQGTYASDQEISQVVEYLECEPAYARELIQLHAAGGGRDSADGRNSFKARDELYEPAIEVVIREGRGSVSLLQRALGIGYGRAARLIDYMAEDAIVGPYNGSNAREVLVTPEQWEQMKQGQDSASAA